MHNVVLRPRNCGGLPSYACQVKSAGVEGSTRSDFLTPEQSPILVILRASRAENPGESGTRFAQRLWAGLAQNNKTKHAPWFVEARGLELRPLAFVVHR